MLDILKLIRPAKTDAAGLRTKIAEIDGHMVGLHGLVRHAERKRSEALLTKSDREVEALEKDLALAIRNRDRAIAARELMERQAADAELAEARAVLDAERDAAEEKAAKIAARLRMEYERHASPIITLLAELRDVEEAVRVINRKLHEAGRGEDAVAAVEERTLSYGGNQDFLASVLNLTSLRPVGKTDGWGNGRALAADLGLPR